MFAQVPDGPNGRHPYEAIVIGQKPFYFDQERLNWAMDKKIYVPLSSAALSCAPIDFSISSPTS